jgi:glycosyltransferase involved in cell wall biosynthesis
VEDRHLHIVCLDVPYPVDYGGVFDLYHKITALHQAGVKIHLHCFEYGRGEQDELQQYCAEVHYYTRCEGHKAFSHRLPYIVCSRSNSRLLNRLAADDHPILLEGIHCSYLVNDARFATRKIILRLHNVEYRYYRQLFHAERSLLKKIYYLHESKLLRQYEKGIAGKVLVLAVAEQDSELYRQEFGATRVNTLPVFVPFEEVRSKEGTGCFCLYQGNLSVAENEQAVVWLLKKVFRSLQVPLVITGKNPSARLRRLVNQYPQACLIPDPSQEEMEDLISKAQINILPSFHCTGIKLKLLNALFNGRHCVVNEQAIRCTGLESLCHVGSDAEELKELILELHTRPFTADDIEKRRQLLAGQFNNEDNAERLIRWIW